MAVEVSLNEKQAKAIVDAGFDYVDKNQSNLSEEKLNNLTKALERISQQLD